MPVLLLLGKAKARLPNVLHILVILLLGTKYTKFSSYLTIMLCLIVLHVCVYFISGRVLQDICEVCCSSTQY